MCHAPYPSTTCLISSHDLNVPSHMECLEATFGRGSLSKHHLFYIYDLHTSKSVNKLYDSNTTKLDLLCQVILCGTPRKSHLGCWVNVVLQKASCSSLTRIPTEACSTGDAAIRTKDGIIRQLTLGRGLGCVISAKSNRSKSVYQVKTITPCEPESLGCDSVTDSGEVL